MGWDIVLTIHIEVIWTIKFVSLSPQRSETSTPRNHQKLGVEQRM